MPITTKISDELKAMGVIDGPVWKDCCSHKPEDYVATFEYSDVTGPPENRKVFSETIDLYVIQGRGDYQQSLCLRFGNEPPDYYSGPLEITYGINHLPYTEAKAILLVLGSIRWHRKE